MMQAKQQLSKGNLYLGRQIVLFRLQPLPEQPEMIDAKQPIKRVRAQSA